MNSSSATESNYRFYDSMTRSNISKLQVPILNTYSEQWWIPNHTFDYQTTTFYYMKPDNSGDLYHYNDGYSLMAFDLLTETERKILNFDQDLPLRLSPNGRWLLVGYQLEKVIDLESHDIHSLLHW